MTIEKITNQENTQLLNKQLGDIIMNNNQSPQKPKNQRVNQLLQKTILPCVFAASFLLAPVTGFAVEFAGTLDGMSITDVDGTNSPPTASFTYTINGNDVTFDASDSVDSDGSIIEYKWDFGDGTTSEGNNVSHQYQDINNIDVTLTITDNDSGLSLLQKHISYQEPVNIAINFQPADVEVPTGFFADSGGTYDETYGYGWTSPPRASSPTAERNNPLSLDKTYDTLIIVLPSSKWEKSLPNGSYHIKICVGDATYPSGKQFVQVEGHPVIEGIELNSDLRWIQDEIEVNVSDQHLTITFEGDYERGQLNWLEISSI